ncbi:DoxX family protein [Sporolituus thermophilus]|uniref:Putative oxidoreductase n=1 Tax=Sporolituus thermophilus DSM 23256 TaxID=1123285 RepID=A0A1G7IMW3_9FIRM|nr:DoxX family protein [Sporolituus thermophilus]SDF14082.1 putative oxidoreductase [Sporolituus thermophilus DSM 23256]
MVFSNLHKYKDEGLLILRLGMGTMMMYHGAPKIFGGVAAWAKVGAAMKFVGITFAPEFWGFMAAVSEFIGGLMIVLGLGTRLAALFLTITMGVAAAMKFGTGAGLFGASQALENGIVYLSLIIAGPGIYSLDEKLFSPRNMVRTQPSGH